MDVNGLQTALARQARPLKPLNPLALPREDFERVEICRTSPSEGSVHQIDRAQVGDVEDLRTGSLSSARQLANQPGSGGAPVTLHRNHRDGKRFGDFPFAKTAKEA